MIVSELVENGERIRHWSDASLKICQVETGHIYEDAVDVIPCPFTYVETDEPIPEDPATVEDKAEAYDILVGVSE